MEPLPKRREDPALVAFAIKSISRGYAPVHWVKQGDTVRADTTGKVQFPSHATAAHVCRIHGNMVKVLRETHPGEHKGIIVLSVMPCPFCTAPTK